ncbi:MAG: purine-nucleoside phosphorylase [Endomicrobium sp.]|jgi:purine-nucleoside phosphorylase|nr:purine-nucleoside phosphorylase [Endomicrobium sp.]
MDILKQIKESADFILKQAKVKPAVAIIAGSGVSGFERGFKILKTADYLKIPHFAKTTVAGHSGKLDICHGGLLIFNGRFHFYEGHSPQDIIYPIRVMKACGVETLIITAAAGAINKKYKAGDIVVLKDHINFTGSNPLRGRHFEEFGQRFPEMSCIYDVNLRKRALSQAKKLKIAAYEGVYFGVSGPSYETPAEAKAYGTLGGDVAGMSVVYEAIAALQMKIKVLALTYVSNGCASVGVSHREVLEVGKCASGNIVKIITAIIKG